MNTHKKKVLQLEKETGAKVVEVEVPDRQKPKVKIIYNQATEVGFSVSVPISLGALLGVWLDERFSTHPKFTLSLLFGGILLAFVNLVTLVKRYSKEDRKSKPKAI